MVRFIFGKMFNIFDIILISIILGYSYYIYVNNGIEGFLSAIGDAIFTGIVIAYLASWLIRKARK